jgi:hypothetical protein
MVRRNEHLRRELAISDGERLARARIRAGLRLAVQFVKNFTSAQCGPPEAGT